MRAPRNEQPVFREWAVLYRQSGRARSLGLILFSVGLLTPLVPVVLLGNYRLSEMSSLPAGAVVMWLAGAVSFVIGAAVELVSHRRSTRPHRVRIEVQDTTLLVDGKGVCDTTDLVSGALVGMDVSTRVILWTKPYKRLWTSLCSEFATREAAERFLLSCAVDRNHAAWRFRLIHPGYLMGVAAGCGAAAWLYLRLSADPLMGVHVWLLGALPACAALRAGSTSLVLASDGLGIRRFFRTRFVAFTSMRSVATTRRGVRISLRTGEELVLEGTVVEEHSGLGSHPPSIFRAMTHAIQEELAKQRSPATFPVVPTGLGVNAYRASSVTLEHLRIVLDDPDAADGERIEAARVLRARDPSAENAIRVAASTTASPPLHSALLRVADPANQEVVEAAGPSNDLPARSSFRR